MERTLAIAGGLVLSLVAAALLLTRLGSPYLWQDEAQTALIARTILDRGVPHGDDGRNRFSQELGAEYGQDGVWKWHTWLSFYAVAASFAALGTTTQAARLPFALCGLATVGLVARAALVLWRDRRAAWLAAALLTASVPFLILSRQGRYYALASLLGLAGLVLYRRLAPGRIGPAVALFAVATLLFHTHYVYAATLLATLLIHAAWLDRPRLRQTLAVSAAVTVCALPWIAWVSTLELSDEKAARFLALDDTLANAVAYTRLLAEVFLAGGWLLLLPLGLGLAGLRWPERVAPTSRAQRSASALLWIHVGVTVVLLALLSPLVYVRYLAPLVPVVFLLVGRWLASLSRIRAGGLQHTAVVSIVVAFVALGSLRDFVDGLRHEYVGPIEGIVQFLATHAEPGDRVATVYGDLPLKFYTDLRVVGGLTGEDVDAEGPADWILLRYHTVAPVSREVRRALRRQLTEGVYRAHEIDAPETAFENREDPREHRFRTSETPRRIVIWERRS